MRAAVLHGRRDLRIEQVEVPAPGPGEVLLAVRTLGVCGTDAGEYSAGPAMMPIERRHPITGHLGPMIIGHEFAGEVVDVGPDVDRAWVGRLLASCGAISCGRCWQCKAGWTNRCENYSAVGLHRHGAAAQYVATPVANCAAADELGLPPDAAALGQPMSIAVHASRRGRAAENERIVLLGAGGIGAFLTYVLSQLGARVVVVDPDGRRRRLATSLGAAAVAEPSPDLLVADLLGGPPHAVFEASGTSAGFGAALAMLPAGGRLVVVGMQKRPVTFDLRHSTINEHEIIGTNAMMRSPDFDDALRLLATRSQGWDDVAPAAFTLDQLAEGVLAPMAAGASPAVKVLVDPMAGEQRRTDTVPHRPGDTTPERM